MQVQSIKSNNNKISMQGTFFVKNAPVFNEISRYPEDCGAKLTKRGVQYFEDTLISKETKALFKNNKVLKSLSKKYDIFIQYFKNIGGNKNGKYADLVNIWIDDKSKRFAPKMIAYSEDNFQSKATKGLSKKIENGNFMLDSDEFSGLV